MRRSIQAGALGLVLGIAVAGTRGVEPKEGRGVLAGLKVGQPVTLQDAGSVYVVRVTDLEVLTGEEVAYVGEGFLIVRNQAGIETRIPVTSIKAVVRLAAR